MNRFQKADLGKVTTLRLTDRKSMVDSASLARIPTTTGALEFFSSLPEQLKAAELIEFIKRVVTARKDKFPFHLMMGAHVIKVGISPVLIDLIKDNIVTGISLNSAGLIHELEMAFAGKTSEDVEVGLKDGSFGMSKDTGELFDGVVQLADRKKIGLGEAAGIFINENGAKHKNLSLFAAADRYNIPATIHLAIGTDIVQQQNNFDAARTAEASYLDFKILAHLLSDVDCGGVIANIGSAVLLPEVFLKALTVARNINRQTSNITTANFDMINHYRPMNNIVRRPTAHGGRGFNFIGHHEIMIPLLAWGIRAYISDNKQTAGV